MSIVAHLTTKVNVQKTHFCLKNAMSRKKIRYFLKQNAPNKFSILTRRDLYIFYNIDHKRI